MKVRWLEAGADKRVSLVENASWPPTPGEAFDTLEWKNGMLPWTRRDETRATPRARPRMQEPCDAGHVVSCHEGGRIC